MPGPHRPGVLLLRAITTIRRAVPASAVAAALVGALAVGPPAVVAAQTGERAGPAVKPDFNGDGFADLAIGVPLEDLGPMLPRAGAVNVIYGSADGLAAGLDPACVEVPTSAPRSPDLGMLPTDPLDPPDPPDLTCPVDPSLPPANPDPSAPAGPSPTGAQGDGTSTPSTSLPNQLWTQDSPGVPDRAEPGDLFGLAVGAGDFDGDGFDDLAVGAPHEVLGVRREGGVNIIRGSSQGLTGTGSQFWSQGTRGIQDDPEPTDQFGWSVVAADFDGDGFADLAISARYDALPATKEEDEPIATRAGVVNVLYGSRHGLRAADNQRWTQNSPGISGVSESEEMFGYSLAAADFDDDGFADLAIGVPYESHHRDRDGGVHVLRGSRRGLTAARQRFWSQDSPGIRSEAWIREQFGQSLAAGDFDHDGYADLAVGVWFQDFCFICNQGAVNVIYGSRRGLTPARNQLWTQDSPGILDRAEPFDRFGNALAVGDFDGDGFDDLAVGAPREDAATRNVHQNKGGVNVIFGSGHGLRAAGNQHWTQDSPDILELAGRLDLFGLALGAADFDADGASDLAVGVRFEDAVTQNDGAVHVLYGSTAGLTAVDNQIWGQDSPGILDQAEKGDHFGWSLTGESPASGTPADNRP